jgi:Xaa-Pro aminopeptidase
MNEVPGDLNRLREAAAGCDVVLLASPEAVLHFAGFGANAYVREGSPPWSWSSTALLVSTDTAILVVADHLVREADPIGATGIEPYDPLLPGDFERVVAGSLPSASFVIGIEARHVSAAVVAALGTADIRPVDSVVARLCAVKGQWEIERIRVACAMATIGQRAVAEAARVGVSELELFQRARAQIETTLGGRVILAGDLVSGARAEAEQGGDPSTRALEAGDVVICDLAPAVDGFFGDSCSSLVLGANEHALKAAKAASDALDAGAERLSHGRRARDVDAAARRVLARNGFTCPHHMGHGLGLSQLEYPLIAPDSDDTLEAGHVVALEPGIYADGFGVRVEHVFLVTEGGPERLTEHTLSISA